MIIYFICSLWRYGETVGLNMSVVK